MSKVIMYDAVSTVNSIWSVLHISKTCSMDLFLVSLRNRICFDAYATHFMSYQADQFLEIKHERL